MFRLELEFVEDLNSAIQEQIEGYLKEVLGDAIPADNLEQVTFVVFNRAPGELGIKVKGPDEIVNKVTDLLDGPPKSDVGS
jgi:hypothetical protein